MALNTENAGGLLGTAGNDTSKVWAYFLVTTFCNSIERNAKIGEVALIAKSDATVLFPRGKARRATQDEIDAVAEVAAAEIEELVESGEADEVAPDGEKVVEVAEQERPKGKRKRGR